METTKKQKKWSKAMVIYHWLAAIVILGLLLTGIAHMTVLDPYDIVHSISKVASAQGIAMNQHLERVVGFTINNALMNIHFILGYSLGILIIFRIILFFTGDRRVFKMAKKAFIPGTSKHKPLVNWLYIAAYLGILTMAITGLSMRFGRTIGLSRSMHHIFMTIHQGVMFCLLAFVVVHLTGVFLAENTSQPGVVSSMMSGIGEEDEVMLSSDSKS